MGHSSEKYNKNNEMKKKIGQGNICFVYLKISENFSNEYILGRD